MHVVVSSGESHHWEPLLGELVVDMRRLGMRPVAVVDERPSTRRELQRAA